MLKTTAVSALCIVLGALTGCGGGGGGDSSPPATDTGSIPTNSAPTVSLTNTTVVEKSEVSLSATASDDGQIQSYAWQQLSGQTVTLQDADQATVNFIAPAILNDENMSLRVTVTDNDGASTSAEVTIDITSITLGLKISGLVTDGPIPSAKVSINVGDQTFNSIADNTGAYLSEIIVDDSFENSLVKAEATGPEGNSQVKLVSQMGSIKQLMSLAGADGVLSSDEFFGVNITNVSTANSVLLEDANAGSIETLQQLERAKLAADSDLVMQLATAIKLVIDFADEYPSLALPNAVNNTLEFISNPDVVSVYLTNAQTIWSQAYEAAFEQISNDKNLADGSLNADAMVGTFYIVEASGLNGGEQLTFKTDGTGRQVSSIRFGQETGIQEFIWESGENGILLTYIDPFVSRSLIFDDIFFAALRHQSIIRRNIRIISDSEDVVQFSSQFTTLTSYPEIDYPDSESVSTRVESAMKMSGVGAAGDILEMGVKYAISIPAINTELELPSELEGYSFFPSWTVEYSLAEFSGSIDNGGSVVLNTPSYAIDGTESFAQSAMQWSINDAGEIVIFDEQETLTVSLLGPESGATLLTSTLRENDIIASANSGRTLRLTEAFNEVNAPGIYILKLDFLGGSNNFFWLEINADGSGLTVSTSDRDNDGILSPDEITIDPSLWQFTSDGSISLRRYRNYSGETVRCLPDTFSPLPSDACSLFSDRVLSLFSFQEVNDEVRAHTLNTNKFFEDSFFVFDDIEYDESLLAFVIASQRYWIKKEQRPVNIDAALDNLLVPNLFDEQLKKSKTPVLDDIKHSQAQERFHQ